MQKNVLGSELRTHGKQRGADRGEHHGTQHEGVWGVCGSGDSVRGNRIEHGYSSSLPMTPLQSRASFPPAWRFMREDDKAIILALARSDTLRRYQEIEAEARS